MFTLRIGRYYCYFMLSMFAILSSALPVVGLRVVDDGIIDGVRVHFLFRFHDIDVLQGVNGVKLSLKEM